MRLEVLADNKGAVIYVLNRPEIYIGSTESNDIVIASHEISKKHLKLIVTDDQKCFVIDQGSTNGTFINDEQIIPGRREEFKLNTSIRLGDKVLLTLLGKDKGELPEIPLRDQFVEEKKIQVAEEDKTRVISLKTLQKTKTEKVRKKRIKKLEKQLTKKKQVRKDKATLNKAIVSALLVFGLAWGAMKLWDLGKKRKARRTVVAQMKETQIMIDDTLESLEENVSEGQIEQATLLSFADISKHAGDVNCSLPEESYFCKRIPVGSRKKNGAININGQLVIYLEQDEWIDKAKLLVEFYTDLNKKDAPKPESEATKATNKRLEGQNDESVSDTPAVTEATNDKEVSREMLHRIAYMVFLKQNLWRKIPDEIQEYNLYFAFYSGSEMEIESVLAIRARNLPKVTSRFTEDFFRFKKYNPYKILTRLDRFYKIY